MVEWGDTAVSKRVGPRVIDLTAILPMLTRLLAIPTGESSLALIITITVSLTNTAWGARAAQVEIMNSGSEIILASY